MKQYKCKRKLPEANITEALAVARKIKKVPQKKK